MKSQELGEKEIKDGAPFAMLSYVLFLWILVFIFKKDNDFARFHAKQGIVIFVGNILCLLLMVIPVLGIVFGLLEIGFVFASLYGIYLSLTGKTERIYLISDIADKMVI